MLEMSKMAFVAFTQHCIQSTDLVVHHQSIRGSSFAKFFGLVKLTRVIAGKTHSQSPILKTKGVLSNPV